MKPVRTHRLRALPLGAFGSVTLIAGFSALLMACSEAQLVSHATKEVKAEIAPEPEPALGSYKIGKPYEVEGTWYYPRVDYQYEETGIASWYGPGFHGKSTANGERFNEDDLTAAHRTLPMPSMVRVTNLKNGRSLKLKVNDRGPFARGRIIDVSRRAAELLDFHGQGTAMVRVEILEGDSRRLASVSKGFDDDAPAPAAAPTVEVAVAPLGGSPAPVQAASQPAYVGTATSASDYVRPDKILASRSVPPQGENEAFIGDNAVPTPDGVVTVEPVGRKNLYVQAGSFLYFHNADRLRVRLMRTGDFFVDPVIVDGRHFFRVRMGPVESVEEADSVMTRLLSQGHNETRIVVD